MDTLQGVGVPAGAMLRVSELPDFDYYRQRGFFRPARHPFVSDQFLVESAPVRSERLIEPPDRPAPLSGEHSAEIVGEKLGLSVDEIRALLHEGVLEQQGPQ